MRSSHRWKRAKRPKPYTLNQDEVFSQTEESLTQAYTAALLFTCCFSTVRPPEELSKRCRAHHLPRPMKSAPPKASPASSPTVFGTLAWSMQSTMMARCVKCSWPTCCKRATETEMRVSGGNENLLTLVQNAERNDGRICQAHRKNRARFHIFLQLAPPCCKHATETEMKVSAGTDNLLTLAKACFAHGLPTIIESSSLTKMRSHHSSATTHSIPWSQSKAKAKDLHAHAAWRSGPTAETFPATPPPCLGQTLSKHCQPPRRAPCLPSSLRGSACPPPYACRSSSLLLPAWRGVARFLPGAPHCVGGHLSPGNRS